MEEVGGANETGGSQTAVSGSEARGDPGVESWGVLSHLSLGASALKLEEILLGVDGAAVAGQPQPAKQKPRRRPVPRIFRKTSHTILAATPLLTHFGAPGSAIG